MDTALSPLNDDYWSDRYRNRQTGWDTGAPTTPLKTFIDQYTNKQASVLIPGCGNAHEAFYLLQQGFTHITLLDISSELVNDLREKLKDSPAKVIHADFFAHEGQYDLILEQTFFCALDPSLRSAYVQHMHQLLKPGGLLAGVLFDRSFEGGPPFGGSAEEYTRLFSEYFREISISPCYNSIPPRKDTECFIIIRKMAD